MRYPEGHFEIKRDMLQRIERLQDIFDQPVEGARSLNAEACDEIRTLLRQLRHLTEAI